MAPKLWNFILNIDEKLIEKLTICVAREPHHIFLMHI